MIRDERNLEKLRDTIKALEEGWVLLRIIDFSKEEKEDKNVVENWRNEIGKLLDQMEYYLGIK